MTLSTDIKFTLGLLLLSNCVFLFMIYAPQSPTPLPKLRLMQVCLREFSQPEVIPLGTEALRTSV